MAATSVWDVNWIDQVRTIAGYFIKFGNSPETRTFTWPRAREEIGRLRAETGSSTTEWHVTSAQHGSSVTERF